MRSRPCLHLQPLLALGLGRREYNMSAPTCVAATTGWWEVAPKNARGEAGCARGRGAVIERPSATCRAFARSGGFKTFSAGAFGASVTERDLHSSPPSTRARSPCSSCNVTSEDKRHHQRFRSGTPLAQVRAWRARALGLILEAPPTPAAGILRSRRGPDPSISRTSRLCRGQRINLRRSTLLGSCSFVLDE